MYHFHVNKDGAQPIYVQIKDQLLELISQEQLPPGHKIPSARVLSEQMKVSRVTVTQALHDLIREGRLFTVTGKGTFVSSPRKIEPDLHTVWGFSETFKAEGYKVSSQLIRIHTMQADVKSARALQVPERTLLICLKRKRLLNDRPVGVETSHLVQAEFPGLEKLDWKIQSLYTVMRERYNIHPVCGTNTIEAGCADEETAKFLAVPKLFPVLVTERITCTKNVRPVEFVQAVYRSDRVRFRVDMASEQPLNILSPR